MIFKLFEYIFPRGVFYDNQDPKGQGKLITLCGHNLDYDGKQILTLSHPSAEFEVQFSDENLLDIYNHHFISQTIKLLKGSIDFVIGENLYRIYSEDRSKFYRVSRSNLLNVIDVDNMENTDPDDGIFLSLEDYH